MAIAIVDTSGTGSAQSFSHDVGVQGTSRIVVILTSADCESPPPGILSGITVDGNAATRVKLQSDTVDNRTEAWVIDEADLGSSSGSVTISVSGGGSDHTYHAFTFSGVDQADVYTPHEVRGTAGPNSSTKTVTDLDCPENGVVLLVYNLADNRTFSSITSPMIGNSLPVASGNGAFTFYGIETSAQVDKDYVMTLTSGQNRSSHIGVSWPESSVQEIAFGQASEADTAQPVAATAQGTASVDVGQAVSTEIAGSFTPVAFGTATVALGTAVEASSARPIPSTGQGTGSVAVGLASEADTARPVSSEAQGTASVALGTAVEADTSQGVTAVGDGVAPEPFGIPGGELGETEQLPLLFSIELNTANAIAATGQGSASVSLGLASEANTALAFTPRNITPPGFNAEVKVTFDLEFDVERA